MSDRVGGAGGDDRTNGYVPAVIPPDPARDARVRARRAEDAARAGRALDRLLADVHEEADRLYTIAWQDGYRASEEHHNGHYDVSLPGQQDMPE